VGGQWALRKEIHKGWVCRKEATKKAERGCLSAWGCRPQPAGYLSFHGFSLPVHDDPARGIRRALPEEVLHGAVELIPVGEPKVQGLLPGFLTVASANENDLHPVTSRFHRQKKARAEARALSNRIGMDQGEGGIPRTPGAYPSLKSLGAGFLKEHRMLLSESSILLLYWGSAHRGLLAPRTPF